MRDNVGTDPQGNNIKIKHLEMEARVISAEQTVIQLVQRLKNMKASAKVNNMINSPLGEAEKGVAKAKASLELYRKRVQLNADINEQTQDGTISSEDEITIKLLISMEDGLKKYEKGLEASDNAIVAVKNVQAQQALKTVELKKMPTKNTYKDAQTLSGLIDEMKKEVGEVKKHYEDKMTNAIRVADKVDKIREAIGSPFVSTEELDKARIELKEATKEENIAADDLMEPCEELRKLLLDFEKSGYQVTAKQPERAVKEVSESKGDPARSDTEDSEEFVEITVPQAMLAEFKEAHGSRLSNDTFSQKSRLGTVVPSAGGEDQLTATMYHALFAGGRRSRAVMEGLKWIKLDCTINPRLPMSKQQALGQAILKAYDQAEDRIGFLMSNPSTLDEKEIRVLERRLSQLGGEKFKEKIQNGIVSSSSPQGRPLVFTEGQKCAFQKSPGNHSSTDEDHSNPPFFNG